MPPSSKPASIRRALLRWYDANRRSLPWRATDDPYAIWLSEVMLQQTTVPAVAPRWQRFLDRFPTVRDLAAAPLDEVLAEWSGLGYYARARNLHAAAQRIVDDFGGTMPRSFEALLSLPGMGRYTAAAVASIAFGEAVAAVDANVERVIARLDAIETPMKSAPGKRIAWERARELVDSSRPGDWNQAMMELGAMVCIPARPRCSACPLTASCAAFGLDRAGEFPVTPARSPMRDVREAAVVIRRGGRLLALLRPPAGSFASMWELPRIEAEAGESSRDAARRAALVHSGLEVEPGRELLRLRHVVMRRRIVLSVWEADHLGGRIRRRFHAAHEWITPEEWAGRAISVTQKDIALFLAHGRQPAARRSAAAGKSPGPDLFDDA